MAEEAATTEDPSTADSFGGGETSEAPAPQAPDVSEQIQALRDEFGERFEEFEQSQYEPEEDGLLGYDEYGNPVYEDDEEEPQAYEGDEEVDPEEALRQYVRHEAEQIAQAAVAPLAEQREMDRRSEALADFADQYQLPRDESGAIQREAVDAIAAQLEPVAAQYGPGVYTDPELVKRAWLAHVAEEEAANEVPAEEAMRAGAVLETGAGPGNAGAAQSEDDQIKREIRAAGGPGNDWFAGA